MVSCTSVLGSNLRSGARSQICARAGLKFALGGQLPLVKFALGENGRISQPTERPLAFAFQRVFGAFGVWLVGLAVVKYNQLTSGQYFARFAAFARLAKPNELRIVTRPTIGICQGFELCTQI